MRNFKRLTSISVLTLLIIFSGLFANAERDISVKLDGNSIVFDQPPIIESGRTLVPVRAIFEALGATVDWLPETRTVVSIKGDVTVRLQIDSVFATVNGSEITLDVPAQIVNGRTLVPLRFVGESFGLSVGWIGEIRQVTLDSSIEVFVHFIDVGQGDAIFVDTPDYDFLIDAGDRNSGVLEYLIAKGVEELDFVIGTHPHTDHIGGLIEVLQSIRVKEVIDPGIVHTTKTFEDYLTIIEEKDIKFTEGRVGEVRDLGNGIKFKIIHPENPSSTHLNNASIVVKLTVGEVSFLFTGDAEREAEQEILGRNYDLRSTVLKVGHHGSSTSTTDDFLNAINPEVAVIQVGEGNRYGHPSDDILKKLHNRNINIYRTDIHGTIIVSTNGRTYDVNASPYSYTSNAGGSDSQSALQDRVNINTASLEDLIRIIHINETRANDLISKRPFTSIEDMERITGIASARIVDIKEQGLAYVD